MASGFFALLDDIATLMDDVVVMSKISTKQTAGILGDDLAVNAEKASGFVSSRELPVLWAITKGSFLNKLIILPFAFLLSAFLPDVITIILVLGGVYLAYEGAEKIFEYVWPHHEKIVDINGLNEDSNDKISIEKKKIKSAIVTDFILSVEIVIIALGTVIDKPILFQIPVVFIVAMIATIGVYGIVALIVRMDDFGFRLMRFNSGKSKISKTIGNGLVKAMPMVIKGLSLIGTIALILVSGGIFAHNIDLLHHFLEQLPSMLRNFVFGLVIGIVAVVLFEGIKKVIASFKKVS